MGLDSGKFNFIYTNTKICYEISKTKHLGPAEYKRGICGVLKKADFSAPFSLCLILLVFVCWFSFVVFPPLLLLQEFSWVFSGFRWFSFSSVFAISIPNLRGKQSKSKAGKPGLSNTFSIHESRRRVVEKLLSPTETRRAQACD